MTDLQRRIWSVELPKFRPVEPTKRPLETEGFGEGNASRSTGRYLRPSEVSRGHPARPGRWKLYAGHKPRPDPLNGEIARLLTLNMLTAGI
jgi:hypothetical protein